MKIMGYLSAFMVITLLSVQCYAKDVVVATDTWENYTNEDGTGYYLDVLRAVFPAPEYKLKIKRFPYKRALHNVEHDKADITLGVCQGDMPDKFLAMKYIDIDSVDLLVNKEISDNWQGLKSLKDKKVVAKIGYGFDAFFEVPINYTEKAHLLGMMKMLGAGRVDAVLDYKEGLEGNWEKSKLGKNKYSIVEGVISSKTYFAFATKSQDLKNHFLKVFPSLVKSGKILEIGKKYNIPTNKLPQ